MAEEGLRERKKRQARQHIAETARGLFLERGFDAVTMAEIAEAAGVSVNTVYNYFPAKEELFLERARQGVTRPSRFVRDRAVGESAAEAVLRGLEAGLEPGPDGAGLVAGYGMFVKVVDGSPSLKASTWHLQQETLADLEATLREEADAQPGERLPALVAGQLVWVQASLLEFIGRESVAGTTPERIRDEAHALLAEIRALLGEQVLGYARRPAP